MARIGVYDQIKKAFQDIVAPEMHELRGEIRHLDQKIDGVDTKLTALLTSLRTETGSMKAELIAALEARRPS